MPNQMAYQVISQRPSHRAKQSSLHSFERSCVVPMLGVLQESSGS